jgi:hypothetical protein
MLDKTTTYDSLVFDWYRQRKVPVSLVLADGLPSGPRPLRAYLRELLTVGDFQGARLAWNAALAHGYADDSLASEYVTALYADHEVDASAHAWTAYLGDRRRGYLETDWIFNGGFESDLSRTPFDWRIESLNDDVRVRLDSGVARSGRRSLRIEFGGKKNVNYNYTSQSTLIGPGVYRFRAFVRTRDITTDQGVGFHLFGSDGSARVDVTTTSVTGTSDWRPVEQTFRVPDGLRLLTIQVVRQQSLKFNSLIGGTGWVDDVSLTRIE